MTVKNSKTALFTEFSTSIFPDNQSKDITPERLRDGLENLYDTLGSSYQVVANKITFNGLALSTDFKEFDYVVVTKDEDGQKGIYQYLRNRGSGLLEWIKLNPISNKLIDTFETSISDYISNDWTDEDLQLWNLIRLTTARGYVEIYILKDNNGSVITDYQILYTNDGLDRKGIDIVSANNLPVTSGNSHIVTGSTQINLINSAGVFSGQFLILKFSEILTIKHNQTLSGDNKPIILQNGKDYITSTNDILTLWYNGNQWEEINGLSLIKNETIQFAISDEESDLETGTNKITLRMPFVMTLLEVRANVNTAPTGSNLIIDINKNGSTILSTKLSIDVGEKTSVTASIQPVISDNALTDDSEITVDINQIGSTVAGIGLKLTLIGDRL